MSRKRHVRQAMRRIGAAAPPALAAWACWSSLAAWACSSSLPAEPDDGSPPPPPPPPPSAGVAFPGCEGWGCETAGGRGGTLYIITSTDDAGPGTLREALEASEPRYIIAGVDGVVRLESFVRAGGGHVTINFMRPPGGGITVTGKAIRFDNMTDVVILGLRYRGTDKIDDHNRQGEVDCVSFTSVKRAVVAHSSFYGCVDEAVSIERARVGAPHLNEEITVQFNLFWEGCMIDCQEGQGHARPINVSRGWNRVAIHHNVLAGNEQRSPQFAGCEGHPQCDAAWPSDPLGYAGYNLVAHWLDWATHVKNGARVDLVENVFVPGPEARRVAIDVPDDEDFGTTLHLAGNQECPSAGGGGCGPATANTAMGTVAASPLSGLAVAATPWETLRTEAWIRTLGPRVWDAEDERALAQLLDGSMRVGGGYDPNTYQPPTPVTGTRLPDRDGDGIPDAVDPEPDAFSAWDDTSGDGWTDLEAYLFGLPISP